MKHSTFLNEIEEMQCMMQDITDISMNVIHEKGSVLGLNNKNQTSNDVTHDFIFFCYTKGIKTSQAIDKLLTEGFFEDAKILARSAYECYLNAAFSIDRPEITHLLVEAKIGIYAGHYKHPKSKKGRDIYSKLLIPETGESINTAFTLKTISEYTYNNYDKNVHQSLYSFLSEYTHVHMMASGPYRTDDQSHYTTEITEGTINSSYHSIFICLYISWLLLDMAIHFLKDIKKDESGYLDIHESSRIYLLQTIDKLDFSKKLLSLDSSLKNRLSVT